MADSTATFQDITATPFKLKLVDNGDGSFSLATSGGGSSGAAKAANIDDAADVALNNGSETTLLTADATRRDAVIVADPANTGNIRIGMTGQVGAARGALLAPGAALTLSTAAKICGWATSAGQKVSLVMVKD